MELYGETMRIVREQKGLTLKQLAHGILSVSFLSKFERGESDISLHYFVQLIERLSLTFEEFFYIHNQFQPDKLEHFFHKTRKSYYNRDLKAIHQLKTNELEKWTRTGMESFRCNALMLGVYESILSENRIESEEEELEVLCDYLFKIEVWGYYELNLYNSTILLMPIEMVLAFSKTAYEKSIRYQNIKKIHDSIIAIMINTLIYLIGPINADGQKLKKYKQEADTFFSYLENVSIPEDHLLERVELLFLKGIYQIKLGDREAGISVAQQAIHLLTTLEANHTASNLQCYLDQLVAYAN